MLPSVGVTELVIIFMIVLVIFGPKALPRVGSSLGRGIREFKDAARGLTSDLEDDDHRRPEVAAAPQQPLPDPTRVKVVETHTTPQA